MEILKKIKNPLTGNVIKIKIFGLTIYRRGDTKSNTKKNVKGIFNYLLNIPKGFKGENRTNYKYYTIKCPSCGYCGSIDASNETIINCPKCTESFKLKDCKRKEIVKDKKTQEKPFVNLEEIKQQNIKTKFVVKEPNYDAINGAMEFSTRLRNNELLGINFKETAKANMLNLYKEL